MSLPEPSNGVVHLHFSLTSFCSRKPQDYATLINKHVINWSKCWYSDLWQPNTLGIIPAIRHYYAIYYKINIYEWRSFEIWHFSGLLSDPNKGMNEILRPFRNRYNLTWVNCGTWSVQGRLHFARLTHSQK